MSLPPETKFTDSDYSYQLAWCLLPELDLHKNWRPPNLKLRLYRWRERHKIANRIIENGIMALTTTQNQNRNLVPLFNSNELEPVTASLDTRKIASSKLAEAKKQVYRLGLRKLGKNSSSSIKRYWKNLVKRTAWALVQAEADLKELAPKQIFVSTQHNAVIRAYLIAATKNQIITTYFPHAPVADNPQYLDLPVHRAALRGKAEIEFYQDRLQLNDDRIFAIGDLSTNFGNQSIAYQIDKPIVLALSPNPRETIQRIINLVASAEPKNLVVAPHPRQDLTELSELLPSNWQVLEKVRTIDYLQTGASGLIHYSSGVALEAALLGIPSANIVFDGAKPNYPFLNDPALTTQVSSVEALISFITKAETGEFFAKDTQNQAKNWRLTDGIEAINLAKISITAPVDTKDIIFDGWQNQIKQFLRF